MESYNNHKWVLDKYYSHAFGTLEQCDKCNSTILRRKGLPSLFYLKGENEPIIGLGCLKGY